MIIEFVKRTADEEIPTLYKCVYWPKGNNSYFKGEILVDFDDGKSAFQEFISTTLDGLKVQVYEFVADLSEYEYVLLDEFNITKEQRVDAYFKANQEEIQEMQTELNNHPKNCWGEHWIHIDKTSDILGSVVGICPDGDILAFGNLDNLDRFFDKFQSQVLVWDNQQSLSQSMPLYKH